MHVCIKQLQAFSSTDFIQKLHQLYHLSESHHTSSHTRAHTARAYTKQLACMALCVALVEGCQSSKLKTISQSHISHSFRCVRSVLVKHSFSFQKMVKQLHNVINACKNPHSHKQACKILMRSDKNTRARGGVATNVASLMCSGFSGFSAVMTVPGYLPH